MNERDKILVNKVNPPCINSSYLIYGSTKELFGNSILMVGVKNHNHTKLQENWNHASATARSRIISTNKNLEQKVS